MREIKFRAFNSSTNEMISWDQMGDDHWDLWHEFKNCDTIMQYTGLKDKNGVEIYEGDLVSVPYVDPMGRLHRDDHNGTYAVVFEHGEFALKFPHEYKSLAWWCETTEGEYIPNYGIQAIIQDITILKVVGNTHQNPELLNNGN